MIRQPPGRLFLAILTLLCAPSALAGGPSLEGYGRLTGAVGWRLTPNDYFASAVSQAGKELAPSAGGPAVVASFAYSAIHNVEVVIDLHASTETLRLSGEAPLTSITYGALAGVRFQWPGLLHQDLIPSVGVLTGPSLVYLTSSDRGPSEALTNAWAGSAALSYRLSERYALTLEYRLLLATRGQVPDVGSVNGGGQFFMVGLTAFLPPEPGVR